MDIHLRPCVAGVALPDSHPFLRVEYARRRRLEPILITASGTRLAHLTVSVVIYRQVTQLDRPNRDGAGNISPDVFDS